MTVSEILQSVRFVIDQEGKVTAAVLDLAAWEAFLSILEDIEDRELIRARMQHWRNKEGWTAWEEFAEELNLCDIPLSELGQPDLQPPLEALERINADMMK